MRRPLAVPFERPLDIGLFLRDKKIKIIRSRFKQAQSASRLAISRPCSNHVVKANKCTISFSFSPVSHPVPEPVADFPMTSRANRVSQAYTTLV